MSNFFTILAKYEKALEACIAHAGPRPEGPQYRIAKRNDGFILERLDLSVQGTWLWYAVDHSFERRKSRIMDNLVRLLRDKDPSEVRAGMHSIDLCPNAK